MVGSGSLRLAMAVLRVTGWARKRKTMTASSAVPVPASHLDLARDAEPATRATNAAMAARLPFADTRDFEAAQRGLIAPVPDGVVTAESGTVLWNLGEYAFIDGELAPATVNPSLWRTGRLNKAHALLNEGEPDAHLG